MGCRALPDRPRFLHFPIRSCPASVLGGDDRFMPSSPALPDLFQSQRNGLAGAVRGVLGGSCEVQEVLQDAFLRLARVELNELRQIAESTQLVGQR